MKIFVTNLKGFDERKNWIINHFKKHNLDFEFIDCIDGRIWNEDDVKERVSENLFKLYKNNPSWLTNGAIAATQTHIENIYKRIVSENIEFALCCEDDILLCKDFKNKLLEIEKKLKEINFEGVALLHYIFYQKTQISNLKQIPVNDSIQILELGKNQKIGSGAAYIISKRTAQTIIGNQSPIRIIADWWHDHPIIKVHFIFPTLIKTGMFSSTLGYQSNRFNYLYKLIPKPIKRLLRMKILKKKTEKNIIQ